MDLEDSRPYYLHTTLAYYTILSLATQKVKNVAVNFSKVSFDLELEDSNKNILAVPSGY